MSAVYVGEGHGEQSLIDRPVSRQCRVSVASLLCQCRRLATRRWLLNQLHIVDHIQPA